MGFSPGCARFCRRWRGWGRRGQSRLAQDGVSNWERPICPSSAKRGTWEMCLSNLVLTGKVDLSSDVTTASWRSLQTFLGSIAGKTTEANGEPVRSQETLVCLHSGSKRSKKSQESICSLLSCLSLPHRLPLPASSGLRSPLDAVWGYKCLLPSESDFSQLSLDLFLSQTKPESSPSTVRTSPLHFLRTAWL